MLQSLVVLQRSVAFWVWVCYSLNFTLLGFGFGYVTVWVWLSYSLGFAVFWFGYGFTFQITAMIMMIKISVQDAAGGDREMPHTQLP